MKNLIKFVLLTSIITVTGCETTTPVEPKIVTPSLPSIVPSASADSQYSTSLKNIAGFINQLSDEIVRAAEPTNLATNNSIASSLDRTTLFARSETIDGAKAYAVLAAANSPAFTAGINKIGTPIGRANFIAKILSDPNWVKNIEGYNEARDFASQAIGYHIGRIETSAASLKKISYDMQKLPMSKTVMPKDLRLKAIDTSWATPISTANFDASSIKLATSNIETIDNRIMAAAALYIIRADKEALDMLRLGTGNSCAKTAYIDLKMCVSATKFSYEHTFCMSEYYKDKYGQCLRDNLNDPVEIKRIRAEAAAKIAKSHETAAAKAAAEAAAKAKKTTTKTSTKKK